jgi:hypothetical protein
VIGGIKMSMNINIQNKVLKIASNNSIESNMRLAVRKQFYDLKIDEINLEEIQQKFQDKVKEFEKILDNILGSSVQTAEVVDEEIVVPTKQATGVKVRMQEEMDVPDDNSTDFEVPYELEDTE